MVGIICPIDEIGLTNLPKSREGGGYIPTGPSGSDNPEVVTLPPSSKNVVHSIVKGQQNTQVTTTHTNTNFSVRAVQNSAVAKNKDSFFPFSNFSFLN